MKFLAAHSFQVGENQGNELDAFGLFKLTHFSKRKKGYMPNVQSAIVSLFSYACCFQLLILNCSKLQMLFADVLQD
jgi:hypothetical protein